MFNLYAIGGALVTVSIMIGSAYLKGRFDERERVQILQLKEYQQIVDEENKARKARVDADNKARLASETFMRDVRGKLTKVREEFDALPMVSENSSGCPDINDNFRLRWNSAEAVFGVGASTGSVNDALRGLSLPDAGRLLPVGPRE